MIRLRGSTRLRDVFPSIFARTKRCISTNEQNGTGIRPLQNSFQPIKMAYSSYETVNSADLSSNIPIIIMHGLLGSKMNWNSLSKAIHNTVKRKVITVDARNHGDSPHASVMSYPAMADDVRQLMIDLNIPKATVIGHSMGGRTMMFMALKYPELVEQLLVVDISPVRDSPHLSKTLVYIQALLDIKLEPNQPIPTARKQADKQLQPYVQDKSLRQFFLTNLVEAEHGTFRWKANLEVLKRHFTKLTSFPSINASFNGPAYFIGGSRSDYMPREDHENIKKFFPKAVFEYIEDTGHWLHTQKPAEFVEMVCKFLMKKY